MKYDDNDSDDARTLLLHNYDKLSRIFLIYFTILIFSRTTNYKSKLTLAYLFQIAREIM